MAQPAAAPKALEPTAGVEVAALSLRAILSKFPADLKDGIKQMPDGEVTVVLPVNTIMKQLPSGCVKMSLGSLLRQAPDGTFGKINAEEKRMVDVPLAEVFRTINMGRLQRRAQRDYDVPDEVEGLFGRNGGSQSVATPSATPAETPASAPEAPRGLKLPTPAPAPAAPQGLKVPAPTPAPAAPQGLKMPAPQPAPVQPKVLKMPSATPAPVAKDAKPASAPVSRGATPSNEAVPSAAPASLKLDGDVSLSIVEIASGWPEGIRGELSILGGDAKVVIPTNEVGNGLQKGRVAFTWAQIKRWIVPAAPASISIPDETVMVLPLKVVAPAFVAASGATKRASTTAVVNTELPDFFGPSAGRAPEAAAPAPAAEAVAPTPAPEPDPAPEVAPAPATLSLVAEPVSCAEGTRESLTESVPVPAQAAPAPVVTAPAVASEPRSLAELFNNDDKSEWSPNELVNAAGGLPGVLGSVVALGEGLVVAHKLPEGLSAETFAAFMPQIFSRLDKYTGEMQLGETTEVSISTSGGPCQIFREGKVFVAFLGTAERKLPPGLRLIAKEISAQNS